MEAFLHNCSFHELLEKQKWRNTTQRRLLKLLFGVSVSDRFVINKTSVWKINENICYIQELIKVNQKLPDKQA